MGNFRALIVDVFSQLVGPVRLTVLADSLHSA